MEKLLNSAEKEVITQFRKLDKHAKDYISVALESAVTVTQLRKEAFKKQSGFELIITNGTYIADEQPLKFEIYKANKAVTL